MTVHDLGNRGVLKGNNCLLVKKKKKHNGVVAWNLSVVKASHCGHSLELIRGLLVLRTEPGRLGNNGP